MNTDILIGLDYYWDLIGSETVRLPAGPTAIGSRFGWLISGVLKRNGTAGEQAYRNLFIRTNTVSIQDQLQEFWNLESIGILSKEGGPKQVESEILSRFEDSILFENGRYQVRFPWKNNVYTLNDNRSLALQRFFKLMIRLGKEPTVLKEYDKIIKDQLQKNFIEHVEEDQTDEVIHYIAHHLVVREGRQTTKVRIVYDASARQDRHSSSLNECMHPGPDLIGNLFAILLRFREGKVALISDIEKAFLQVGLQAAYRNCTRFFWIPQTGNMSKAEAIPPSLKVFRFTRVLFGIISSPFLLNATMQHHLRSYS